MSEEIRVLQLYNKLEMLLEKTNIVLLPEENIIIAENKGKLEYAIENNVNLKQDDLNKLEKFCVGLSREIGDALSEMLKLLK
ncbi:hypothetical protein DOK76_12465 [Vagococcus sp. DIV0080]|uniref:Uncharacterized protein n=1 Tax=Candidatus Vagococcus giribetii TaxID=2230876 RepID=A0ABS3HXG1_9ENTE|nr:hypothetical protein [Vagococcus sp. DIV0080]MBO0477887.1 hypothetical protein [Vagococcus sp. DIV0080]